MGPTKRQIEWRPLVQGRPRGWGPPMAIFDWRNVLMHVFYCSFPEWPYAFSCGGWSSHSQGDRHKKHTRDSLKGRTMEGETTSLVPHHRPESFWDFRGARHERVGRSGWERGRYLLECVGRRIDVPQPAAPGFHCGSSMESRVHPLPHRVLHFFLGSPPPYSDLWSGELVVLLLLEL